MLVSVCMPWGPRCFRCMLDMLSTPTADEFLSCFIMSAVSSVVASMTVKSKWNSCLRLYVRLSSRYFGKLLIF